MGGSKRLLRKKIKDIYVAERSDEDLVESDCEYNPVVIPGKRKKEQISKEIRNIEQESDSGILETLEVCILFNSPLDIKIFG